MESTPVSFHSGKFGRLTIRKEVSPDVYLCDCTCGNSLHVWRSLLTNDVQIDCGMCVLRPATNGLLRKPYNGYGHWGHTRHYWTRGGKRRLRASGEYHSYTSMIARCYCKSQTSYDLYGGRGIRVSERWKPNSAGDTHQSQGFKNFIDDMGPRPAGKTLDRIEVQGHYEKSNCRWADPDTQHSNQRRFLYKDCEEPPVEDFVEMERRIEEELGLPF